MRYTVYFFLLSLLPFVFLKAQNTVLLESSYYSFQSNAQLNAHLYLYNKAMTCKFKKTHPDSLAHFVCKDKLKLLKAADLLEINNTLRFYTDSLTSKDLVFDSLMRDFADQLTKAAIPANSWQVSAYKHLISFQPYFTKLYWKNLEAQNKAWVIAHKAQILQQEKTIIPELERIYQTVLPDKKVIVNVTCYATWTGAYSYRDGFCHTLLAATHGANKGDLATEVLFGESSLFLVPPLKGKIDALTKGKDIKSTINVWKNMISYTTGYVLEHYYAAEGKLFFPNYVQMKLEDKFPDFKHTLEACKLYWEPYLTSKTSFDEAVKAVVKHVQEKH